MKIGRKNAQLRREYGYRMANPETDFYIDGTSVKSNYVVIVRIKDCRIYEDKGHRYYDATNAPAIQMSGHSLTSAVYGKRSVRNRIVVEDGIFYEKYYQTTLFHVIRGRVYSVSYQVSVTDAKINADKSLS
jgi:acetylornithine/succinyldiaminopimelate/putrescine aminotransferase